MDRSNIGEDDEDPTHARRRNLTVSKRMIKSVKRTRTNYTHLTDEEKCLRKRFLGRERARRYRERKRTEESAFHLQNRRFSVSLRPRSLDGVEGRRRRKNTSLPLLLPKPCERKVEQTDRPPGVEDYDLEAGTSDSTCTSDEVMNTDMEGLIKEDHIVSRNLMAVDNLADEPAFVEMKEPVSMELQDTSNEPCPDACDVPPATEIKDGERLFMMSTDSCQKEGEGKSGGPVRNTFKQQNVKDFINFFPVDNSGTLDSKSFVTGSCSMQKKVEHVPSTEKTGSSKATSHEVGATSVSASQCPDTVKDAAINESSLSDAVSEPPKHSDQTCLSTPLSDGTSSFMHPSNATSVPASASFQMQQTLANVQVPGHSQENKLIHAATSNIQAVNTVVGPVVIGSKQTVSDCKEISSLQGIVGLQNVPSVGTVPGMLGLQGACVNGAPILQGVQGIVDPRLVSLAGMPNMSVLQDVGSLQGVLGGCYRLSDVQGMAGLPNVGLLQGTTNPSALGACSLQSIQSNQAVSGNAAIPGLQSVPGLQGLVSIPGLSTIPGLMTNPSLSSLPGVQGVSIIGPQVGSVQTVTPLQGNTCPQGIVEVQGVSGLLPGVPVPSNPGESSNSACPVSMGQNMASREDYHQGLASLTRVEGEPTHIQQIQENHGDRNDSSEMACLSPVDIKPVILASGSPEKFKIRSRRKQASPRCISEQQRVSFHEIPMETNTNGMIKEGGSKSSPTPLDNISQCEAGKLRPSSQAKAECSRQGEKLSRKVEELKSARKSALGLDCSLEVAEEEESPSPETWRRFVERQKQLSDRLRVVENQLKILQAIHIGAESNGNKVVGQKSVVSIATQTDNRENWQEEPFQWTETVDPVLPSVEEMTPQSQSAGTRTHGQIQQGVVTSSGDSAARELFSEVIGNDEKTRMGVFPLNAIFSHDETPESTPPPADVKPSIVNRPRNIWLASHKRKRRVAKTHQKPSAHLLSDVPESDPKIPINGDACNDQMPLPQRPEETQPIPEQPKQQYVYQIQMSDVEDASGHKQHTQCYSLPAPDLKSNDNTHRKSDQVQPWEVEGLSKIERNRIRAREGMRKHREKLRQAKFASETRMLEAAARLSSPTHSTKRSKAVDKSKSNAQSTYTLQFSGTHNQTPPLVTDSVTIETQNTEPLEAAEDTSKRQYQVVIHDGKMFDTTSLASTALPSPKVDEAKKVVFSPSNSTPAEAQRDHSPGTPENNRIDFTKEPYRSMSLQERNRLRAREGMRRYRERMKQARLHADPERPSQTPPAELPAASETLNPDVSRAPSECPSDSNQVAAADHLVELARRHSKSIPSIPSYSERMQQHKVEALKRRRAQSLVRSTTGASKSKILNSHIAKPSEREQLLSSADIVTLNRIMGMTSGQEDLSHPGASQDTSKQIRDWSPSRKKEFTRTKAMENYLKTPEAFSVCNEQSGSDDRRKLKSEKRRKLNPDMAQRKRLRRNKAPCRTESAIKQERVDYDEEVSEKPNTVEPQPLCQDLTP